MNEKQAFAERLRAAMMAAGYEPRPVVLEREFNQRYWGVPVTFQAVRRWLRGDSIPTQDKLEAIALWLQVSPQFLRFGESVANKLQEVHERWERALIPPDRDVLELYLGLPDEEKVAVRSVIEALAARRRDD